MCLQHKAYSLYLKFFVYFFEVRIVTYVLCSLPLCIHTVSCLILSIFACIRVFKKEMDKITYNIIQASTKFASCWSQEAKSARSALLSGCKELVFVLLKSLESLLLILNRLQRKVSLLHKDDLHAFYRNCDCAGSVQVPATPM